MIAAVTRRDLHAAEDEGELKRQDQVQRLVDIEAEGERAALNGLGAGLASIYDGPELSAFTRGFLRGAGKRAARSPRPMPFRPGDDRIRCGGVCLGCTCGGRGICVGDAQ